MQKNTKKRKFGEHYVRYLISYMTVLLIPLVILTFFYASRFMMKFYDEIYETVDLELLQIITHLSALTSANPFIQDIVLILDGKEYVTTSSTTCQKDYYFDRIFKVPGMNSREFQSLL